MEVEAEVVEEKEEEEKNKKEEEKNNSDKIKQPSPGMVGNYRDDQSQLGFLWGSSSLGHMMLKIS